MARDHVQLDSAPASQKTIVLRAAAIMLLVILAGTFAFLYVEPGWTVEKALFFTLITLTTVGYDDQGIDANGRWIAIALMVVGIGTVTWALGQIVQTAVSYQLAWQRRMQGRINKMKNHIIICGVGRVGGALCRTLSETKIPFVVVERDAERVAWALEQGYTVINGCGTDDDALIEAGLHRARGIVACTSSDPENIMVCLSAREISEQVLIVGRANQDDSVHKLKRAGASRVMAPAYNAGKDIATYLANPALADFLDQTTNAGIGFRISECVVGHESPLLGHSIADIGHEHPTLIFVAIKHADGASRIRPGGDEPILEDDILVVVGDDRMLAQFFELAHGEQAYEHRAAG